jgi:hypothetical protein
VEFALRILAALIGATGAFAGTWLSGRHERQLEHERWERTRLDAANDARATAITELTKNLAAAAHALTWFTWAAEFRAQLFTEQTVIDYDTEIRAHLVAVIQSLVAVAHRDEGAFRTLVEIAKEVWVLDGAVGIDAAAYWTNSDNARTKVASYLSAAVQLEVLCRIGSQTS